jgi:hypothetical protein
MIKYDDNNQILFKLKYWFMFIKSCFIMKKIIDQDVIKNTGK